MTGETSQHLLLVEGIPGTSRHTAVVPHPAKQEAGRGHSCWASPSPLLGQFCLAEKSGWELDNLIYTHFHSYHLLRRQQDLNVEQNSSLSSPDRLALLLTIVYGQMQVLGMIPVFLLAMQVVHHGHKQADRSPDPHLFSAVASVKQTGQTQFMGMAAHQRMAETSLLAFHIQNKHLFTARVHWARQSFLQLFLQS